MGDDELSGGEPSFGDVEHLKGFQDPPADLSQEKRELVLAMRGLFEGTGLSLRGFAATHHFSAPSISRYLKGDRIPDKQFLDVLMKSACRRNGLEVDADLQAHLYQRHRDALLSDQPARYREQMASDRLEDAILEREQAELRIRELEGDLSDHRIQLDELQRRIQEPGAQLDLRLRQKADLEVHCARLRASIEELEASLAEAVRERDAARMRCAQLEAELATAEESAERERLERLVTEERLREANAAGAADQHRADLDAARREAEAQARQIIEEATSRVTIIRPSIVSRSAALRQLRDEVLHFAEVEFPGLAELWSSCRPELVARNIVDGVATIKPIGIQTKGDIGEVARAIDALNLEAARIVAVQTLLRSVIGSALRRQSALIEALDDGEHHRLAHLIPRLRRSNETLQLLAGESSIGRRSRTVPLVDLLRQAAREAKQPERLGLSHIPEVDIHGPGVTGLVHLLAELLDNATTFSPPPAKVRIDAHALPDGRVMIEIHDQGLGLTPDDFADINHRLASLPEIPDVKTSQHMGLFVVSRICRLFAIRVQLRPGVGGVTALVMLPAGFVHLDAQDADTSAWYTA
ncbi:ATP-binding protein [Streptomyces sp. NBC_01275]|uniref:ATP-binding protein n=1 Tax=Streptomyces sp. NBC_01275 TaxID=2903807 RepID=UPI0022592DB6|nr:ATP-binding protein [Streptomyces sp. NBC_01275]MCX4764158.1 ATP-binding protein [Streptomyces sp. NBC_01275]